MRSTLVFMMVLAAGALVACGVESSTDAPKAAVQMPGTMEPAGKGDWRTRYYTDVRGEVHMNDTRYDSYNPLYPDYYNGYEIELEAGDVVDIRVGASDFSFDSVIGVYGPQRPSGEWGNLRAVNDDTPEGGSFDSYIPFEADRSGKYLVLVQDYSWTPGDLWVSLSCESGPCEQDSCEGLVTCRMYCENGFARDENGCEVCACAPVEACPSAEPSSDAFCASVVTYGKNPDGGECCQYPSPCHVPDGWETFSNQEACEGPATVGEACALYGRQCEAGLECDYLCPDGTRTPGCNLGINPQGFCAAPAAACVEGDTRQEDCNTCTCTDGAWACTELACAPAECTTDADCVVSGCSGQVCAAESVITTCDWRPEYACYGEPTTSCGCNNGQCGWAATAELDACLNN